MCLSASPPWRRYARPDRWRDRVVFWKELGYRDLETFRLRRATDYWYARLRKALEPESHEYNSAAVIEKYWRVCRSQYIKASEGRDNYGTSAKVTMHRIADNRLQHEDYEAGERIRIQKDREAKAIIPSIIPASQVVEVEGPPIHCQGRPHQGMIRGPHAPSEASLEEIERAPLLGVYESRFTRDSNPNRLGKECLPARLVSRSEACRDVIEGGSSVVHTSDLVMLPSESRSLSLQGLVEIVSVKSGKALPDTRITGSTVNPFSEHMEMLKHFAETHRENS
eukprot:GHVU01062821.1.p1 GENE.GHVU01062821.1~~GHVU01062821.1.p1  ORF type:complete len:281 (+),score=5.29 GHVU01062821.1:169-1011(+)